MKTVEEIKTEVIRLARKINAPDHYLPFYPYTNSWDGCLDLAVDQRGYHLINVFRGKEEGRFTTFDFDELLYKIMKNVAWSVSQERAVQEGGRHQAHVHLKHEIAVLSALSSKWAERREKEEDAIT